MGCVEWIPCVVWHALASLEAYGMQQQLLGCGATGASRMPFIVAFRHCSLLHYTGCTPVTRDCFKYRGCIGRRLLLHYLAGLAARRWTYSPQRRVVWLRTCTERGLRLQVS